MSKQDLIAPFFGVFFFTALFFWLWGSVWGEDYACNSECSARGHDWGEYVKSEASCQCYDATKKEKQ